MTSNHASGLGLAALLVCSGCARGSYSQLVPKLELCLAVRRAERGQPLIEGSSERFDTGFSALLKWQPWIAARSVPARVELVPGAWLAPCALDDAVCLNEVAEVEREIADALGGAP